jgi:large subunit ribosomal protein L10
MVSENNKQKLKEVKDDLRKYPVIGIIDMFKLPARQIHDIREKLRKDAKIKMVKKRIIKLALKECGLSGIEELEDYVQGEPALLLSSTDPFRLSRTIVKSKSRALAKEGDVAPRDIVVRAGPTPLAPGPVIGELQRVKIPAMVEGEKISVRADTLVAKEGDIITKGLADVMAKLGIEPMEIGLNLVAAWEGGYVYPKEILFTPVEKYVDDLKMASSRAFNLACNVRYYTRDNVSLFLSKAHNEAFALALQADILTEETVKALLAKAHAQAEALRGMVKEPEAVESKPDEKEGHGEETNERTHGAENNDNEDAGTGTKSEDSGNGGV